MYVDYYEAKIPARGNGQAARVQVTSPGGTVALFVETIERGTQTENMACFEMSVAETVALIEGLFDALVGRCVTFDKRNAILRKLELHPKPMR